MNKKLYSVIFKHQYENLPMFTKRLYKEDSDGNYYCPKEKITYEEAVEALIRERYTISDELSFIRQKDVKPDEYQSYFDFIEECKSQAKEFIEERKNWLN